MDYLTRFKTWLFANIIINYVCHNRSFNYHNFAPISTFITMKGHSQTSFKTFHFLRAIDAPNTFHFYKEIRQLLFQVEMGTSEVVVGRNGKPLFPNSYKWLINWQVQPWNSCLQFASWLSKYCFVLDCWIEEFLRGETIQSYETSYVRMLLTWMHAL